MARLGNTVVGFPADRHFSEQQSYPCRDLFALAAPQSVCQHIAQSVCVCVRTRLSVSACLCACVSAVCKIVYNVKVSECVCVCVGGWNTCLLRSLLSLIFAGGARGLQKAGTNEDLSAFL